MAYTETQIREQVRVKEMLVKDNVIDLDMAMRAWAIKVGSILITKDGRQVRVVSIGNDQMMIVELGGKQAQYNQGQIIRSILSGNMALN